MTARSFIRPAPLCAGDKVAVLSPSSAAAAEFPHVVDLGLSRLRDVFRLEPVEFPCTRAPSSPAQRAADVNAAFADPSIAGVIATIGGDDQLKVLPHLDASLIRAHPKRFFGYSDNTNLHHFLWGLGIVSYYGGSVMVQLGRPGAMHQLTADALHRALFTEGPAELPQPEQSGDVERPWSEPDALDGEPPLEPAEPWVWHGSASVVEGRSWGGCLEIVDYHLRTGRWLRPLIEYDGCVLLLETSEELPSDVYVGRVLTAMGERGLLQRFAAVLVGRPKAWSLEQRLEPPAKRAYVERQRAAVSEVLAEYHPDVLTVFGVDFGHTDPQLVVPHGGTVRVDGVAQTITVEY
jgi:muramoyltetrapeptide carboxypeptidase LdcA involved in peptidoglycan recycling